MEKETSTPELKEIFAEADKNTNAALESAFGSTEEAPKEEVTAFKAVEEEAPSISALLAAIPGAPKAEQIEAWKKQHGDVYVLPLDAKEMYIWRPLRHLEYQNLVGGDATKSDASFREAVVLRALLWPKLGPEHVANTRAGLMDTLFQVIMQGSYFLAPEFALSLVEKL